MTTELAIPDYPFWCRRNIYHHLEAWTGEMRRSPRTIFKVAAAAAKATDFILGFTLPVETRHRVVEEGIV